MRFFTIVKKKIGFFVQQLTRSNAHRPYLNGACFTREHIRTNQRGFIFFAVHVFVQIIIYWSLLTRLWPEWFYSLRWQTAEATDLPGYECVQIVKKKTINSPLANYTLVVITKYPNSLFQPTLALANYLTGSKIHILIHCPCKIW